MGREGRVGKVREEGYGKCKVRSMSEGRKGRGGRRKEGYVRGRGG